MSDGAPPWNHVVGRMAAVGCRTARGELRYREPGGGPDDDATEGTTRFWHAAPHLWRIEDDDGVRYVRGPDGTFVRSGGRAMQRLSPNAIVHLGGPGDPTLLLTGTVERFTDRDDFSVPLGLGAEVRVAGRRAWEYVLAPPPHKPHPLRVAVDDETGTVLRLAVPEAGVLVEMTAFEPDVEVPDGTFGWDGLVRTDLAAEIAADDERRRALSEMHVPVPRWWPDGVARQVLDGDPATGAFSATLEVRGWAEIARWPTDGTPPPHWLDRWPDPDGRGHVHRWDADGWHWELAVPGPLPDEVLARVVASIGD
ncbi:hypothetical protein [Cellulomonas carbonis]|uniref:Uncharacterized protein n=1 Tax=Cellulomonas carbonis T26 TaxID=947969 RepID=A0A0A0BUL1_9CELL|nr:hypothetical protein [Cellulomonas carbonis]KGM12098.1 hypothetical protein N868_02665 [Cellulomonas carbonis T26]GGC08073.1 hypothetical protein GCM10010972_21670 [Cellulomonas carbonis]